MPKVKWGSASKDEALTAQDIDEAPEGFQPYAGEIPAGGVYRFRLRRLARREFGTGNEGMYAILELDGGWRSKDAPYDGCPVHDNIVFTKASASFVAAFAEALGVSSKDIISSVVVDEAGLVTMIGKTKILPDMQIFMNTRRGSWNEQPRLEKAGTGYLTVEKIKGVGSEDADDEPAQSTGKKDKGKKDKGKKKTKAADDEAPF